MTSATFADDKENSSIGPTGYMVGGAVGASLILGHHDHEFSKHEELLRQAQFKAQDMEQKAETLITPFQKKYAWIGKPQFTLVESLKSKVDKDLPVYVKYVSSYGSTFELRYNNLDEALKILRSDTGFLESKSASLKYFNSVPDEVRSKFVNILKENTSMIEDLNKTAAKNLGRIGKGLAAFSTIYAVTGGALLINHKNKSKSRLDNSDRSVVDEKQSNQVEESKKTTPSAARL
jgi:hypothetical protein